MKQEYSFQMARRKFNHLLFMGNLKLYGSNQNEIDGLVRTVKIVTKDIGMKFDIDKYGVLALKREEKLNVM